MIAWTFPSTPRKVARLHHCNADNFKTLTAIYICW